MLQILLELLIVWMQQVLTAGNTINPSTGAVTYVAGWSGTSTITATAAGCNGPKTATHTVTTNPPVGTPAFTAWFNIYTLPGFGPVTYTATAANTTGITYTLMLPVYQAVIPLILQPEP